MEEEEFNIHFEQTTQKLDLHNTHTHTQTLSDRWVSSRACNNLQPRAAPEHRKHIYEILISPKSSSCSGLKACCMGCQLCIFILRLFYIVFFFKEGKNGLFYKRTPESVSSSLSSQRRPFWMSMFTLVISYYKSTAGY